MIFETLKQFNWLDITVIILAIRICYAAIKSGFLSELFKILGTIFAVYLSLHYFSGLSEFIKERFPVNVVPDEFLNFLSFVILAVVGYLVFVILRVVILRFVKMEAVPKLSRWGGLILGMFRVLLLAGLVVFILALSSVSYVKRSAAHSYSGKFLFTVAPSVYGNLWNGLVSKFAAGEKFNEAVSEVQLSDSSEE